MLLFLQLFVKQRDFDNPAEFFAGWNKTWVLNRALAGKKQASALKHLQKKYNSAL